MRCGGAYGACVAQAFGRYEEREEPWSPSDPRSPADPRRPRRGWRNPWLPFLD